MQAKARPSGWAIFGGAIAVTGAVAVSAIIRGLVLSILWGWFVEPLGIEAIDIAEAIGLSAVVGLLWQRLPDKGAERLPFAEAFWIGMVGAAAALSMGWVAHLFV